MTEIRIVHIFSNSLQFSIRIYSLSAIIIITLLLITFTLSHLQSLYKAFAFQDAMKATYQVENADLQGSVSVISVII